MGRLYVCSICKQVIPDRRSSVEMDKCRHCYQKEKHGVLDIDNCHQGSVIPMED